MTDGPTETGFTEMGAPGKYTKKNLSFILPAGLSDFGLNGGLPWVAVANRRWYDGTCADEASLTMRGIVEMLCEICPCGTLAQ